MLEFHVQVEGGPDRVVRIEEDAFTAGSGEEARLRLEDPAAEPAHFRVEVREAGVVLVDNSTAAGTRVNGEYVSQVRLHAGDVIEVGGVRIVRALQTAGAPEPAPAAPGAAAAPVPRKKAPRPASGSGKPGRGPRAVRRRSGDLVPAAVLTLLAAMAVAGFFLLTRMGSRKGPERAARPAAAGGTAQAPAAGTGAPGPGFRAPGEDPLKGLEPVERSARARPVPSRLEPGPGVSRPPKGRTEPRSAEAAAAAAAKAREEAARRAERERRVREAERRLAAIRKTLRSRIDDYDFGGPLAELDDLLDRAPPGRARDEAAALRSDLFRARRVFRRLKEVLGREKGRVITLSSGLRVTVTGTDEEGFEARIGSATARKKWIELDPGTVLGILTEDTYTAEDCLDLAAFGAVFGLKDDAERELATAFRRDAARKPEIDAALARLREVEVPAGGFVLHEGRWVTPEEKDYLDRGFVFHEGKWLSPDEYREALGWVKVEGKWLSPRQYRKLLAAQKAEEELARKYMPKGLIDRPGYGKAVTDFRKNPVVVKTRHYRIKTDLSREVANDVAYTMEVLRSNFLSIFGMRSGGAKFTVNLVANRDEYRKTWRRAGGSLGFAGGGQICTFYQPPMTTSVLMHEGTHQFIFKFAPTCPRWLHEGMATFFECSKFEFDKKRKRPVMKVGLLNSMRLSSFQREVRMKRSPSLEVFMRGRGGNPYADGWALVYYLAKGKGGQYADRLQDFVRAAGKGDAVKHFKEIFKIKDLAAFEKEWRAYIMALDPAKGVSLNSPLR